LGRANPRSYHNIGEAFDIRPMQGVDFGSYVSSLKNAGLPVVESLDEATNPKPWTTGPTGTSRLPDPKRTRSRC
jgi:hypothetical protein